MGRLETAAKNAAVLYMFCAFYGGKNGKPSDRIPTSQKQKINSLVEKWLEGNYSGKALDRKVVSIVREALACFRKHYGWKLIPKKIKLGPVVTELVAQFPTEEQLVAGMRFVFTEMCRLAADSGGDTSQTLLAYRSLQEAIEDKLTAGTRGALFEKPVTRPRLVKRDDDDIANWFAQLGS